MDMKYNKNVIGGETLNTYLKYNIKEKSKEVHTHCFPTLLDIANLLFTHNEWQSTH